MVLFRKTDHGYANFRELGYKWRSVHCNNTITVLLCSVIRFSKMGRSVPSVYNAHHDRRGMHCVEHVFTRIPPQSIGVKSLVLLNLSTWGNFLNLQETQMSLMGLIPTTMTWSSHKQAYIRVSTKTKIHPKARRTQNSARKLWHKSPKGWAC